MCTYLHKCAYLKCAYERRLSFAPSIGLIHYHFNHLRVRLSALHLLFAHASAANTHCTRSWTQGHHRHVYAFAVTILNHLLALCSHSCRPITSFYCPFYTASIPLKLTFLFSSFCRANWLMITVSIFISINVCL